MAQTSMRGNPVNTAGDLPGAGSAAPAFTLTGKDLKPISLEGLAGQNVVLNIFPSIDTAVCATSVRTFNERAAGLDGTTVVCVSADLPFAAGRFCGRDWQTCLCSIPRTGRKAATTCLDHCLLSS